MLPLTVFDVPLEALWAPSASLERMGAHSRSLLWSERVADGEWW